MNAEVAYHPFGDPSTDDFVPKYRAITAGGARRGIRLEGIYWRCLNNIAEASNCTIGDLIAQIEKMNTGHNNVTSSIRVACMAWMSERMAEFDKISDDATIRNLVHACSSPAIVLSADKRLHSFNRPFLHLVTQSLSLRSTDQLQRKLKLLLDVQIEIIIQQLEESGNRPMPIGILIGLDDRSMRSTINVVLAPRPSQDLVFGYLLQ